MDTNERRSAWAHEFLGCDDGGTPTYQEIITEDDLIAAMEAEAEAHEQYREDSVLLHQIFAALQGSTEIPFDPLPPGEHLRTGELGVLMRVRTLMGGLKDLEAALSRIRNACGQSGLH